MFYMTNYGRFFKDHSRAHESSEKEVKKDRERKWSRYADDGEEKHARADESFGLRLLNPRKISPFYGTAIFNRIAVLYKQTMNK